MLIPKRLANYRYAEQTRRPTVKLVGDYISVSRNKLGMLGLCT